MCISIDHAPLSYPSLIVGIVPMTADTEEETEADTEEEEDSDAEDGGPRRARKRPLEVAEEDYTKPNKWASA